MTDPSAAGVYFSARLAFETDCSDVASDLQSGVSITLIDARSGAAYAEGHVPGAISLPHGAITRETTAALPADTVLVTYCWGPHCNAATKAAAKLSGLGFTVKEMLGGYEYWCRDGYQTE